MTREEAIKIFQRMKKIRSVPNSDAERTKEAIDMAIEALTNQSLSKSNNTCEVDLISRQAAIDAVEKAKTVRSVDGEIFCAKINAQMNIQHLPSVQPEIVRCKDCKFGVYEKGRGIYHTRCEILEFLFQDDDYCSYGEREEEEWQED